MATFFIILLVISIVGLVSLIAIKRWELATGRVLMGGARPAVGHVLGSGLHMVERQVPGIILKQIARLYRIVRAISHRLVALLVLYTESLLEWTLTTLRQGTDARPSEGPASEFLREVAQHKKALQEGSKEERAIYEE